MRCTLRSVIATVVWKTLLAMSPKPRFRSLPIALLFTDERSDEVVEKIEAALTLIREVEPHRFRRLVRDLGCIVVLRAGGPEFLPPIRGCLLGQSLVLNNTITGLALMIVHEAAHARLWRRGFSYDPALRSRVERACIGQEIDLAERLPDAKIVVPWVRKKLDNSSSWSDESRESRRQAELDKLVLPSWVRRLLR